MSPRLPLTGLSLTRSGECLSSFGGCCCFFYHCFQETVKKKKRPLEISSCSQNQCFCGSSVAFHVVIYTSSSIAQRGAEVACSVGYFTASRNLQTFSGPAKMWRWSILLQQQNRRSGAEPDSFCSSRAHSALFFFFSLPIC